MATINIAGTYYAFTITAGNATTGATYTNNSITYTVVRTVAAGTTLYVTGTANSTTSGSTLTKASGTGDATLTFSLRELKAHINNIGSVANGDDIVLSASETLVIDETPTFRPANITATATTFGKIDIRNTSTTVPIVINMNTENADINVNGSSRIDINGNWILVGTGTGLSDQTIDFSNIGGVSIDLPPVVWVETFDSSDTPITVAGVPGYFRPFFNAYQASDTLGFNVLQTCHGDLDHGHFFQFDRTSRIATFGRGGAVSKVLGGTNMSAGTHSGNTATITVGVGHGVVANDTITVSGVTGAGAAGYNGTHTVNSVTATTIVYVTPATSTGVAAIGGQVDLPLGGARPASGARMIYPNIHFTSNVFNATVTSRNELRWGNGGSLYANICAFSLNWVIGSGLNAGNFGCNVTEMNHCAWSGRSQFTTTLGPLTLYNCASTMDYTTQTDASTHLSIASPTTSCSLDYIYTAQKTNAASQAILIQNVLFPTVLGTMKVTEICTSTTTGSQNTVYYNGIAYDNPAPLVCGPLYCVGGRFVVDSYTQNLHVNEVYHSDKVSAALDTVVFKNAITLLCKSFTVAKVRKMTNGAATRNSVIACGVQNYQVCVKDVVYDGVSNPNDSVRLAGQRSYATNITANGMRTSVLADSRPGQQLLRYSNIRSNNTALTNAFTQGGFVEWGFGVRPTSTNGVNDMEPFNTYYTNTAFTTGELAIGPFCPDVFTNHLTVISGTEGVDWYLNNSNAVFYEGNGVELIFTNQYPIRGVDNFTGASWTVSGTNYNTNATHEFSMKMPTDTAWGSWYDATTAANWQTALAALIGYTSAIGFNIRYRITTSAALAGRVLNNARITCTPDAAWTPAEIGYVPITMTQTVVGSGAKIYVNTVPASPVAVDTLTFATATDIFDFPYDFDALPRAYRLKVRKSGYTGLDITGNTYQSGVTLPLAQLQIKSINDVTAAAITGVTVNGATNTVTVTSNISIGDFYDYVQWWAAQTANMDYDIPLVTTDLVNYTSTYDIVLNGGSITGAGEITTTGTLTISGSETSTVTIAASNGTTGFLNITGLSSHAVYLQNASATQMDYQSSVTGTYSYFIPNTATGTWRYVVKKAGFAYQTGTFVASAGGVTTVIANTPQKFTPDGLAMYTATSDVLCRIVFTGSTQASIDIGNGSVLMQAAFDMTEDALATNDGCIWLATRGECSIFRSASGNYLFLNDNWRIRRWNAADILATLLAYVSSTQGITKDGSNGDVVIFGVVSASDIAAAVLAAMNAAPPGVNVKQMNNATVIGNGTASNLWRGGP